MEQGNDHSHDGEPAEQVHIGEGAVLGVSQPATIIPLFTTVMTAKTKVTSSR